MCVVLHSASLQGCGNSCQADEIQNARLHVTLHHHQVMGFQEADAPLWRWENVAYDGGLSLREKQHRLRMKLGFPDFQKLELNRGGVRKERA